MAAERGGSGGRRLTAQRASVVTAASVDERRERRGDRGPRGDRRPPRRRQR